jgi:hypothetical protein
MGNNLNSGFKVHTITNYVGYDWLCNNGEDIKKKKEKKKKKSRKLRARWVYKLD